MPEHHRFLDANRAEATVIEVMEIRTADAAGANADQQLMRFRFGCRNIFNAQIERRVEARVAVKLDAAVSQAEAKQSAEFAKVLSATERQRQADLATFQQAAEYYQKQMARFEVASNGYGQ